MPPPPTRIMAWAIGMRMAISATSAASPTSPIRKLGSTRRPQCVCRTRRAAARTELSAAAASSASDASAHG